MDAASPQGRKFLLPPWRGEFLPRQHQMHRAILITSSWNAAIRGGPPVRNRTFVLDIWERYLDRQIMWHFAPHFDRLELTIQPSLNNAFAGYEIIEVGGDWTTGTYQPFSLNFDVIAHEVAHILIYGEVGLPDPELSRGEYWDFRGLRPI